MRENEIVVGGTFKVVYYGSSKVEKDKVNKYRLAVQLGESEMQLVRAHYAQYVTNSPLKPKWLDDSTKDVINLKSLYEIPTGGVVNTFEEINPGALGRVKILFKESAIYPVAIVISENGEPVDAFEGM